MITGDGDALSIGGNHLIHALRRNVNLTILLFNNRIYGLTKGQYSPTSETGKITKSTPAGSVDEPFNPISLALGAEATFVARTLDSDRKHLTSVLRQAVEHRGSALVEIYQNCPIFNDGAFDVLKDRDEAQARLVPLEHGAARRVRSARTACPSRAWSGAPTVRSRSSSTPRRVTPVVHDAHAAGPVARRSRCPGSTTVRWRTCRSGVFRVGRRGRPTTTWSASRSARRRARGRPGLTTTSRRCSPVATPGRVGSRG